MQVTKKLIRSALWALCRSCTQCEHMHHANSERHGWSDACPVCEKIDFVIGELDRALLDATKGPQND
mgnify:CR=1 FL=1